MSDTVVLIAALLVVCAATVGYMAWCWLALRGVLDEEEDR